VSSRSAKYDKALVPTRACASAPSVRGDLHAQRGIGKAAILAWQRIESQKPAFLTLAPMFRRCLRKLPTIPTGKSWPGDIVHPLADLKLLQNFDRAQNCINQVMSQKANNTLRVVYCSTGSNENVPVKDTVGA